MFFSPHPGRWQRSRSSPVQNPELLATFRHGLSDLSPRAYLAGMKPIRGLTLLPCEQGDARAMRWWNMLVLGGALVITSGCTNAILGVLLAPEGVIGGAVSGLADAGAKTLAGASLDQLSDLGTTVTELDRILQENPDAVNAESLKKLRDQLKDGKSVDSGPDQRQALKEPPKPRRPTDTKMPMRKGDHFKVQPPGEAVALRRAPARPETLPDGGTLRPDPTPVHSMSLKPVRLTQ